MCSSDLHITAKKMMNRYRFLNTIWFLKTALGNSIILNGGIDVRSKAILLCAACLTMTACGKTTNNEQESLTEEVTTITEVTETENSPADNSELIQNYADILYGIFKNYNVATPHTYEQYFTEADISPYYIGEPVNIDIGDHTKKSECTTVTFEIGRAHV